MNKLENCRIFSGAIYFGIFAVEASLYGDLTTTFLDKISADQNFLHQLEISAVLSVFLSVLCFKGVVRSIISSRQPRKDIAFYPNKIGQKLTRRFLILSPSDFDQVKSNISPRAVYFNISM